MTTSKFALEYNGTTHEIGPEETLIGSGSECAVRIEGSKIEEVHASTCLQDGKMVVRVRAKDGDVQVNGKPTRVEDLNAGDILRIGEVELTIGPGDPLITLTGSSGTFELQSGENTLGRDPAATISLDDDSVSREHASILALPSGRVRIRDHFSSNGTFVNDRRLGEMALKSGDKIELGGERLVFVEVGAPAAGGAAADADVPPPPPAGGDLGETRIASDISELMEETRIASDISELMAGPVFELDISGEIQVLAAGSHKIGRAPECEIQITDDSEVSRYHAEITITTDKAMVKDLGSSNGTRVNGERIGIQVDLENGDEIGVGSREMKLRITGAVDPAGKTVMAEDVLAGLGQTVLGPLGDMSAVEAMRDLPEEQREALNLLELDASAGEEEIRNRFKELYSEYQIRTTNAPTPELRKKYENRVVEFRQAVEVLIPPEVGDHNLPSAEPVDAPVGDAAPADDGMVTVDEVTSVPPPAGGEVAEKKAKKVKKPKKVKEPKPPKEKKEGGGVPGSTWMMLVILLVAIGAAAFVFMKSEEARAIDSELQAEFDSKTALVESLREEVPSLTEEIGRLEEGKVKLLENMEVKICNLSRRAMRITWLQAAYIDQNGDFQVFDTANTNYRLQWPIEAGARSPNLQQVSGADIIWDGSGVFFAVSIDYGGQRYFKSGAIQDVGADCYNLRF